MKRTLLATVFGPYSDKHLEYAEQMMRIILGQTWKCDQFKPIITLGPLARVPSMRVFTDKNDNDFLCVNTTPNPTIVKI